MKILKAFKYALKGIIYAIKNERNMRIHTAVAMYVIVCAFICKLGYVDKAVIGLTIGLVIMSEMVNSALENLIDLCSKNYNATAKAAKDIAAGGVLIVSIIATVIGIKLFCREEAYMKLWAFFCFQPLAVVLLLFSFYLSYLYIFLGPVETKNKFKNAVHKFRRKAKTISTSMEVDENSNEK